MFPAERQQWERKLAEAATTKDVEMWSKRVAQKKAQIADEALKGKAKDYGYEDRKIKQPDGSVAEVPAIAMSRMPPASICVMLAPS